MSRLTIQIPKPCPERWEGMQPTEQGRFCANCQKTVVDYTALSDRELVRLLSQPSETRCGRFRDEQLNRPLVSLNSGNVPVWYRWAALLTAGFFGWHTAQGQSVQTQHPPRPTSEKPYFSVAELPVRSASGSSGEWLIQGRVVFADSNGVRSPVPMATVFISGFCDTEQLHTDSTGVFSVAIPRRTQRTELKVAVWAPGYTREQSTFSALPSLTSISLDDIVLYARVAKAGITGGGMCVVQSPSRWQTFWRTLFR